MNKSAAEKALHTFDFNQFLPGQKEALTALEAGTDVITVLPTGGGKSFIYQAYGAAHEGITIIISPLIALMKDQVESLKDFGINAVLINSHRKEKAIEEDLIRLQKGDVSFVFITPERLENEAFFDWLKKQKIALFVIDEAHCISEWGHDFRPAYLQVGTAIQKLGSPLTLALTATATSYVTSDITKRLHLKSPEVIVHGVDRPNLFFAVQKVLEIKEKKELLLQSLHNITQYVTHRHKIALARTTQGSGIIYTSTTRTAREIAEYLQEQGIDAGFYHGRMKREERERAQDDFMNNNVRIMVATNAFGMGIDKSDIRFVIHYDVPGSLESYYQEAGRAGRDGNVSLCLLLYRQEDLGRAAFLSASSGERAHKEYKYGRLNMMQRYTEIHDCRRNFILNYFGEKTKTDTCNFCDNDLTKQYSNTVVVEHYNKKPKTVVPVYNQGQKVKHAEWGEGVVQRIEPETLVVLFESVGHKTLARSVIERSGLLVKQ